jgi:hypothetical protein
MVQSVHVSLGVLLLCLFVLGCHTPLVVKQMQARNPLAPNAAKTPIEIVDVWNSYAQSMADGTIVRGMAGRVHFYDNPNRRQAVRVNGDLTVFVFDGRETDPAHTKPLKIFEFGADTLDQHHSYQTPLGHGYNFFLPFHEIGGEEKPFSIIVRFDDNLSDAFELAQPVNTILAGRRPQTPVDPSIREFLDSRSLHAEANRNMTSQHGSTIQQVGHIAERVSDASERSRVITIPLNSDMTRRLSESPDALL